MTNKRSLVTWRDIPLTLLFIAGYPLATILPRSFDPRLIDITSSLYLRIYSRKVLRLAAKMEQVLVPEGGNNEARRWARQHYRLRIEDGWGRVRGLRHRGWQPRIETEGREHALQSLDQGRGVVFWVMTFGSQPIFEQALSLAGIDLTHLSREEHGAPSMSRFALRVLAPLYVRAETPYLFERIGIPLNGSLGYLNRLKSRLSANGCVSIMGENHSTQNVTTDFFATSASFATGAPALAWRQGSPLLTVFAVQESQLSYRVFIEEPIVADRDAGKNEFVNAAVHRFAQRLQRHIRDYPADWHGWLLGRI